MATGVEVEARPIPDPLNLIVVGAGHVIVLMLVILRSRMFVISAFFLLITSLIVFTSPRARNLEEEIPDAMPDDLLSSAKLRRKE